MMVDHVLKIIPVEPESITTTISETSFASSSSDSLSVNENSMYNSILDETSTSGWGFFEEADVSTHGLSSVVGKENREVWNHLASKLIRKNNFPNHSLGKNEGYDILFDWTNSSPSQGMRLTDMNNIRSAMDLSCCVSGFRICQLKETGEIKALFHFTFNYGSRSFNSYRSFSEFQELANIISYINANVNVKGSVLKGGCFRKSLTVWHHILRTKQFFRNLSVVYLIEKSILIGKFMESILFECPNPALLLCFSKTKKFVA